MNSKEARKKMRDGFFVSCKRGCSQTIKEIKIDHDHKYVTIVL